MCHALYYYLISNYSNELALANGVWSLYASVAVNLCIACLVQVFFTIKIFYLCRRRLKWLMTVPIMITILAHLGFGIDTMASLFTKTFSSLSQFMLNAAILGAFVVISDVLVTIALCVLLRNYSSHIKFPRTKRLVDTLITYAIERCLLTSLVVIADVIVGLIDINSWWYVAIDFTAGRLYTNSLLASLNTRNHLHNHESGEAAELNVDTIQFANLPNSSRTSEFGTHGGGDHKFGLRSQDDLDSIARQEDV
ncbi:hypothetical protein J3A83DRAFT_425109 [Scleroderma citrinum]